MKPIFLLSAICLSAVSAQRFNQRNRNGRQQASTGYGVPANEPAQPSYGASPAQPSYQPESQSDALPQGEHGGDHQGLDWLLESVPGTPGEDYPIYSYDQISQFEFDCNGQVEGGYYADTASECQVFHVCIPDGLGSLGSQSLLCPNGTIFNQEYFICDWWFNFDCAQAEALYSRNDEVAAERESASLSQGQGGNNGGNNGGRNNGGGQGQYNNGGGNSAAPSGSYDSQAPLSNYGGRR